MGLKRKIEIWQFDKDYQIGCMFEPAGSEGVKKMYVSDHIDIDTLIEKLKWIHKHKDKKLE